VLSRTARTIAAATFSGPKLASGRYSSVVRARMRASSSSVCPTNRVVRVMLVLMKPGHTAVDADAGPREVGAQAFTEHEDRRLRSAVGGKALPTGWMPAADATLTMWPPSPRSTI